MERLTKRITVVVVVDRVVEARSTAPEVVEVPTAHPERTPRVRAVLRESMRDAVQLDGEPLSSIHAFRTTS